MPATLRNILLTLGLFALSAGMVRVLAGGEGEKVGMDSGSEKGAAESGTPLDQGQIAEALNEAMANVVERILPGVVSVNVERSRVIPETKMGPLGPQTINKVVREPGVGSGVIVSKEGLVLTNWHVVFGDEVIILVTLHGSEEPRRATLVDKDESVDIALLKIEHKVKDETFPWMVFGDSDLMRPGHMVFAVGAPLNLPETVTQGIISNRARRVSDTLDSYLQTDCTINPGNSGGPLVNLRGELIGINTRLVIGPQQTPSGQAYGLAMPSNEVQDAYERMLNKGRPRGYLGVTVGDWPDMSYQSGKGPESAIVEGMDKGSPAAEAGMQKGDLIQSLDGRPVRSSAEFFRRLRKRPVGETLELGLQRGLEKLTVRVTAVDLKTIFEAEEVPDSSMVAGMQIRGLRRAERARLVLPERGGALVEAVSSESVLHGKVVPEDVVLRVLETGMQTTPRIMEVSDLIAKMEELKSKGGAVDVLRATGAVERLTFMPQ